MIMNGLFGTLNLYQKLAICPTNFLSITEIGVNLVILLNEIAVSSAKKLESSTIQILSATKQITPLTLLPARSLVFLKVLYGDKPDRKTENLYSHYF